MFLVLGFGVLNWGFLDKTTEKIQTTQIDNAKFGGLGVLGGQATQSQHKQLIRRLFHEKLGLVL